MRVNSVGVTNFKAGEVVLFNMAPKHFSGYSELKNVAQKEAVDIYLIAKKNQVKNLSEDAEMFLVCAHNFKTHPFVVGVSNFVVSKKTASEELMSKVMESVQSAITNLRDKVRVKPKG